MISVPYPFEQKIVKNNEKISTIILFYNNALEKYIEEKQRSDSRISLTMMTKGSGRFFKKKERYQLQNWEGHVEPAALELVNDYAEFLNNALLDASKEEEDTEKLQITSAKVLVREVLLRLFVLALDVKTETDFRSDKDLIGGGEAIIRILTSFVNPIIKDPDLLRTGIVNVKISFLAQLSTTHPRWVGILKDRQAAITLIHSNENTISQILDYLNQSKITVMRQIVAELKPDLNAAEIADQWIQSNFKKYENEIIIKHQRRNSRALSLVAQLELALNESDLIAEFKSIKNKQNILINTFSDKDKSKLDKDVLKKKKLAQLYDFLNETDMLFRAVVQISQIISFGGWIPIITNALKIGNLSKAISCHFEKSEALKLDETSPIFKKHKKHGIALIRHSAVGNFRLENMALAIFENLRLLQDPQVIKKLLKHVSSSFNLLLQFSNKELLGIELVNVSDANMKITVENKNNDNNNNMIDVSSVKTNDKKEDFDPDDNSVKRISSLN